MRRHFCYLAVIKVVTGLLLFILSYFIWRKSDVLEASRHTFDFCIPHNRKKNVWIFYIWKKCLVSIEKIPSHLNHLWFLCGKNTSVTIPVFEKCWNIDNGTRQLVDATIRRLRTGRGYNSMIRLRVNLTPRQLDNREQFLQLLS